MFLVTYLPQAAVLALVNGPLAVISAVPLVLSESSTMTNLLARTFFIEDALIDTFDAVSRKFASFPCPCLFGIDLNLSKRNRHCSRRTADQVRR